MTTRETADRIADNPYVKFFRSLAMLIVLPFIGWMTSSMITTVTTMAGFVEIQRHLQEQVSTITQTQTRLVDLAATEAQSRASKDAQFDAQIQYLREEADRIDAHLTHTDDRLNQLVQGTAPFKR